MFIRKILLTCFIVTATAIGLAGGTSLADKTVVNPELYGTWDVLELKSMGMTAQLTLTIEENQVIASSKCSFQDYRVFVQTASPAVITADQIQVLQANSAMKEYSPGFLQCRASLDVGNIQYQLRDGRLVLNMPKKEETYELSRSGGQFRPARQYKKSKDSKLELAYTNRGTTYLKKGQYDEAIREYNKALEIDPRCVVAYYNRSVAYTRIGQYDRAVTDCNMVLQLDSEHAKSYYTRGVSYWHLGSKNQAFKDLKAAAKLNHKGAQDFLKSNGIKW